jgi:hypothetical protein
MNMRNQTKGMLVWKFLLNTSRNSSKSEDSALFLSVIWNAAGQAVEWRGQNEREKSKRSPNLGAGLPHLSTLGPVRGQYFEKLEPGIRRGFDVISDALPFGHLWYEKPNDAVDYAKFRSHSHDAVIRVYDAAGLGLSTQSNDKLI